MKSLFLASAPFLLALSGCGASTEQDGTPATEVPTEAATAVDDTAATTDGAASPDADSRSEERAPPGTMPLAMRGTFARAEVGDPEPSGRACDPAYAFDKVITIRDDGYSLFETGGRITDVEVQSRNSIFATFDTTYADTATSARERFAVSDEGRTLRRSIVGGADDGTIRYRRCPDA